MPASPVLLSSPIFSSTSHSRLKALYSDFSRQKQSNTASYDANLDWWKRSLESYVGEGYQGSEALVLHANSAFMENMRIEGVGRPIGLSTVVAELGSKTKTSQPVIMPLPTFLSLTSSIYASRSVFSYVTAVPSFVISYGVAKPLWWAMEQVGVVGEDSIASSISGVLSKSSTSSPDTSWFGDYVMLGLLEKAGQRVIERQNQKAVGPGDTLYTLEGFRKEFADCVVRRPENGETSAMSEVDMKVLLRYLARDKDVLIVDRDVVKFFDSVVEHPRDITAVDLGILELKTAVESMQRQVSTIQTRIDQYTGKATEALRQGRKPIALSYLRSRRQLEEVLSKRLGALENLQGTLLQVESAAGDIQIVKAYSSSASTLKAILSHPSLQRESLEKTMDALAEANADAREIDETIRVSGDVAMGIDTVDDDEIEKELEELAKESQSQQEVSGLKEKLDGISLVPSGEAVSAEGNAARYQGERIPEAA